MQVYFPIRSWLCNLKEGAISGLGSTTVYCYRFNSFEKLIVKILRLVKFHISLICFIPSGLSLVRH